MQEMKKRRVQAAAESASTAPEHVGAAVSTPGSTLSILVAMSPPAHVSTPLADKKRKRHQQPLLLCDETLGTDETLSVDDKPEYDSRDEYIFNDAEYQYLNHKFGHHLLIPRPSNSCLPGVARFQFVEGAEPGSREEVLAKVKIVKQYYRNRLQAELRAQRSDSPGYRGQAVDDVSMPSCITNKRMGGVKN